MNPSDVCDKCAAALFLEKCGYTLVRHTAQFGTILQYRKNDEWRFVIPSMPNTVLTREEALRYIKEKWTLRHKKDEPYYIQRILIPYMNL